jgi:hypothetical protein
MTTYDEDRANAYRDAWEKSQKRVKELETILADTLIERNAIGTLSPTPRTDAWLATLSKKRKVVTVWQDVVELADFARQLETEAEKSRELLEAWLAWGRAAPPTLLYRTHGHLNATRNATGAA